MMSKTEVSHHNLLIELESHEKLCFQAGVQEGLEALENLRAVIDLPSIRNVVQEAIVAFKKTHGLV